MSESQQDDEPQVRHVEVEGADVIWCGPGEPTEQDKAALADIAQAAREAFEAMPQEMRDRYDERAARGRERLRDLRRRLMED